MLRAFQWDLARQVERLDVLLDLLPQYADWGYQQLYLHLEDAVEYPSLPGVARPDAYRHADLARLVTAASRVGIQVVPIANLLGHTQYLIKQPGLRDLNELRAADGSPLERGQLCPLHPRTLEVAARLLDDVAPFCTAGLVHVGLDESFHLGRHPLSQAEIAERGLAAHFAGYVGRLHGLATARGLRLGLWADMLALLPGAIPLLPRGLAAYDWYYYPFARHPRMELYNFRDYHLVPALRRQGIAYWGCPMNGAFRHEPLPVFGDRLANLRSWWDRCRRTHAEGFLVTSWEPHRLAFELTTVMDAAAACLWLDPAIDDHTTMLARGFERVFGREGSREAARVALRADEHAFAGYARWELNDRWSATGHRDGIAPAAREARLFARFARLPLPEPFAASLGFRHYLAERDVFVRRAAQSVARLRRLQATGQFLAPLLATVRDEAAAFARVWQAGRRTARRMWVRTRDPHAVSPNETVLAADAARLKAWRTWLAACRRTPAHVWTASAVRGPWQLEFTVRNLAPALQKVVVEQRQPDGTWQVLAGRFTIEFRATAARRLARVQRTFSVPVDALDRPLRIGVRGLGYVAISQVTLSDGVTVFTALRAPVRLGQAAPSKGFPTLDWEHNTGERELTFAFPAPHA
jgi:hypothetical protein